MVVKETDLDLSIAADPEASYTLRPLTVSKVREIAASFTRQEFDKRMHRKVSVSDDVAINDALLDYAIENWAGVSNGANPAPCDLAHKLQLPVEVQRAIIERAQVGESSAEVRAQSFRGPA